MRTLEWADVDDDAGVIRLRSEHSKNGESRILPIRGELAEVIARRSALRPLETRRVFHFQGRALRDLRYFWKKPQRAFVGQICWCTTCAVPRCATWSVPACR